MRRSKRLRASPDQTEVGKQCALVHVIADYIELTVMRITLSWVDWKSMEMNTGKRKKGHRRESKNLPAKRKS